MDPAKRRKIYSDYLDYAFSVLRENNATGRTSLLGQKATRDLAPNDAQFATLGEKFSLPFTDLDGVLNSKVQVLVVTLVTYFDTFGNGYETEACSYYMGRDPRMWHTCALHNTIK